MKGRIRFAGNPWPQGHDIADFQLGAFLHEGGVTLSLFLQGTEYSDADGDAEPPEEPEDLDDWEARIVWNNYHRCTIESGAIAGQPVIVIDPMAKLPVLQHFRFDTMEDEPAEGFDSQDNALQCYILGHDAVRDHDIALTSGSAPGLYDVAWMGRVALVYAGDMFYRHEFRVEAQDVPFIGFEVMHRQSDGRTPIEGIERRARIETLAAEWLGGLDGLQVVQQSGYLPDRLIPHAGAFRL